MKKVVLIALLILTVVIVISAVYLSATYRQANELLIIVNDDSIKQDFSELVMGDCSKLDGVENELADVEIKVISACKNPILKIMIKKASKDDICKEVLDPNNTMKQMLSTMQDFCKNQEAA